MEDPTSTSFLVSVFLSLVAALLSTATVVVGISNLNKDPIFSGFMAAMSAITAVLSGSTALSRAKQRRTAQRAILDREAREEDRARAGRMLRTSEGFGANKDGEDDD